MQQKENLSAYIDGEQTEGNFVEALCSSSELQQKWQRYHTMRSVMRGEELILGSDFSAKMEKLLENEEMQTQSKPKGKMFKLKRWTTPLMQLGVAASVCFAVVLGVNTMNQNNDEFVQDQPVLQTLPFTDSVQQVSLNLQEEIQKIEDEKKKQEELKKEQKEKELDKVQQ